MHKKRVLVQWIGHSDLRAMAVDQPAAKAATAKVDPESTSETSCPSVTPITPPEEIRFRLNLM